MEPDARLGWAQAGAWKGTAPAQGPGVLWWLVSPANLGTGNGRGSGVGNGMGNGMGNSVGNGMGQRNGQRGREWEGK